jgi:poly(A) polymerase
MTKLLRGWAEAVWTQGARYGTVGCRVDGRRYEITTHRSEAYLPGSRKPLVEFATDIETDLSRRDFTVNAIAHELPDGGLIDPFAGQADLAEHRLRTPLGPETSFSDDPLRMVRAARFAASHDLIPDADVVAAMTAMAERIDIVAMERIRTEIDRLLVTSRPSVGLSLLQETGLLRRLLGDRAVDAAAVDATGPDLIARLVTLVGLDGDIGTVLRRWRSSRAEITAAGAVAGALHVLADADHIDDAVIRRAVARVDGHQPALLAALDGVLADRAGEVRAGVERLAAAGELDDLGPVLDGAEVMAVLGLTPGPEVGEAMAFLEELRLSEGVRSPEEVGARLVAWWESRQPGPGTD